MRYSPRIVDARLKSLDLIGPAPLLELIAESLVVAEGRLPQSWLTLRDGKAEKRGDWIATGLPSAGRDGAKVTRFRISGSGDWIDGSVSLPNEGGDAFMRELNIVDGQECRVDDFRIIAGNR